MEHDKFFKTFKSETTHGIIGKKAVEGFEDIRGIVDSEGLSVRLTNLSTLLQQLCLRPEFISFFDTTIFLQKVYKAELLPSEVISRTRFLIGNDEEALKNFRVLSDMLSE